MSSSSPSHASKELRRDESLVIPKKHSLEHSITDTVGEKESWPGWCTVESEPAIFNQLLKEIGVQNVRVQEIYALDEDSLRELNPAHGLIFLFRWKEESADNIETTCPENVWFANQVIDNACASLALLNIVFNSEVSLGPVLQSFKDYSKELTPPMKGLAVANFEHIRKIHNTFARYAEMVDIDINLADTANKKSRVATAEEDDDEVFHFIAYVHVSGALWELDGLKRQPVKLHTCSQDEWLSMVEPSLQERISRYSGEELRFNLLAVVPENSHSFGTEQDSYYDMAHRRKYNYESFVHKIAMMLDTEQLAGLLYD